MKKVAALYKVLFEDKDKARVADYVFDHFGMDRQIDNYSAIGLEFNNKIIAGVIYTNYNKANIVCGIAIDGKINRDFLWFIFYYPFMQEKVNRITTYVESDNVTSQRFTTHLGFELESVMKRAGRNGGDLLVFRMFKENCKFLGHRYVPKKVLQQKAA